MATGTTLAQAYIELIPTVRGIQGAVAKALVPGESEADAAGKKQGGLFGGKLASAGALAAAAGAVGIGAALVSGLTKSLDISKANDKLAAQLGLNDKQAGVAGAAAGALYSNAYGENLDGVNEAVGAVMSSIGGMSTASQKDLEGITAKVLDLSTAFDVDVAEASASAGILMKSGLAADADEAMDLLVASMQKVPASVRGEVLPIMDEYSKHFAQLGIDGDDAMGMIVAASANGAIGMDKMGDAVKEFGIRSTDMSKTSGDAYAALGLNQADMTAALLAGGDSAGEAFDTIVAGLNGMTDPVAQSQAALALFGTPLEDLSVTELPAFLDSLGGAAGGLGDVAGAADAMGATLNDNASTNLESFKRQISTAFVDFVGGKALPAVEKLAGFLAENVGPVLDEITGGITAFGAAWVYNDGEVTSSGFPGFMERVGYWARQAFDYVNDTAIPALRDFGGFLRDNAETIRNVATVLGVLLLPALVRAGVLALVSGGQQVAAWVMAQAGAIKAGLVYMAQGYLIIGRWVAMGAAAIVSAAQTAYVWALYKLEAIKGAASMVAQAARVVGGWVLMGVQSLLQAARMAAAWLIAMGPVGWVIAAVVGLAALVIANWDKISEWTAKAWNAITSWVSGAWSNITGAVRDGAEFVRAWVVAKVLELQARWNAIWGLISSTASAIWAGIKSAIYNAIVWVGTVILNTLDGIKSTWSTAWNWVKTTVSNIWDGIKSVISNAWTGVKSTLQTLIDFVRDKIGAAFGAARDAVGTAWDAIKAKVKDPIRAVVGFINEGLIDRFNSIPGVNIPTLKLPRGFKTGGYTGDGHEDEVKGQVHAGEYVFTKAQTAALGKENLAAMASAAVRGQAAIGSGVYGGIPSFVGPQFSAIDRANAVVIGGDAASYSRWSLRQAANMWNGLANVKVSTGSPRPGVPYVHSSVTDRLPFSTIPNWAGYYSGSQIYLNPNTEWAGSSARRTVTAHEIGHALGLPHAMATGANSIMNYGTMYGNGRPTLADAAAMRAIYGPPGAGNVASSVADGDAGGFLSDLIDGLMGKIKKEFPGAGLFVDAAGGLAKSGITQAAEWIKSIGDGIKNIAGDVAEKVRGFFGGGAAPLLYDQGGILSPNGGRPQLIQNKTGRDEYVFTGEQLAARDRSGLAAGVVLQIDKHYGDPAELIDGLETAVRRHASMNNLRQAVKL